MSILAAQVDDSDDPFADEEEDLIEKEKREELERLRIAGIRQKKLEAERKAEEDKCVMQQQLYQGHGHKSSIGGMYTNCS